MNFTTQYSDFKFKGEKSTSDTLVSLVPCMTNQERISQALMTGSLVQAANVGYDIQSDKEITDILFDVKKRNLDIVDRLQAVQIVKNKVENFIRGKLDEKEKTVQLAEKSNSQSTKIVSDEPGSERKV